MSSTLRRSVPHMTRALTSSLPPASPPASSPGASPPQPQSQRTTSLFPSLSPSPPRPQPQTQIQTQTPPPPYSSNSALSSTLTLPSGLLLGYATYGAPTSPHPPIFFFHGSPSSRLEGSEWASAALATSTRLVAIDRWGHGLSSPRPGTRVLDWPGDVRALAEHLRLLGSNEDGRCQGFYVVGASGGGPYALACAHSLPPSELLGTGIVGGVAPPGAGTRGMALDRRFAVLVNRWVPVGAMEKVLDLAAGNAARGPDAAWALHAEHLMPTLSREEQEYYTDPRHEKEKAALLACYREAFRQGGRGPAEDAKRVLGNWGFELGEVKGKVKMWNGGADVNVPVRTTRWMAERIEGAELKVLEGATHFGVPVRHAEEILRELVGVGMKGKGE
ncbi:hypothetical protein DPSP01_002132 [Paraphaeosphaeria sporulosa]